jgi:hypothetical protein
MKTLAAAQIEHHKSMLAEQRARANELEQKITRQEAEMDELLQRNSELTRENTALQNSNHLQTAQLAILTQRNTDLEDTKTRLQKSESDLVARNIEITDRNKGLSAELLLVSQQLSQSTEQMASCREENDRLRRGQGIGPSHGFDGGGPRGNVEPMNPVASASVKGEIVEVRGRLATINVGSSSGLRPGDRLAVLRGRNYGCDLIVTEEIAPTEAVAEVVMAATGFQPRPNDEFMDVATLEGNR